MNGQRTDVSYVYAVGRDTPALGEAVGRIGTAGVAGAPVHVVREAGLGALVADVPADRYGEEGFRAQLEDLAALEDTARAHHDVVAAAFATAVVLPMRLATVHRDDESVARMLAERAAWFEDRLARVDGTLEWGVKVFTDAGRARRSASAEAAAPPAPAAAESPGRAYLRRRRAQRDDRDTAHRCAQALTERVLGTAGEFAVAGVSHRPHQGHFAPDSGENVANLAFLVPSARGDAFCAAVRRLDAMAREGEAPGARVEVTGPWAPYSFAAAEPAGPGPKDAHGR
ncbi:MULTISPECIES: GvpL/GvpF family gas vesicle protein [Streptomycetaceae]|uniref:GvpL/GvpF family gas vesicle protein n=1 Tax=Streptomycetaceae TaxID=2062 RepID=UPI00300BC278